MNIAEVSHYLGITASNPGEEGTEKVDLLYINNPGGSIRWLWPVHLKEPLFLRFYMVQGWKGGVFSFFIRLIFILGWQKRIFKSTSLRVKKQDGDLLGEPTSNWALFTGTSGQNRKMILYRQGLNKDGVFTKIALSEASIDLLRNEARSISLLSSDTDRTFDIPLIFQSEERALSLSGNNAYTFRCSEISEEHLAFFKSMQKHSSGKLPFTDFDQLLGLKTRLEVLQQSRARIPVGMVKKLSQLHASLSDQPVVTHLAHGDFTPWNMYVNKAGSIYVYDWELAHPCYPKAYDLFHFVIQNGILTSQKNWSAIKAELDKVMSQLMSKEEADHYLSLYLLVNVLYYLEKYDQQDCWHKQIYWLLDTWNQALSEQLSSTVDNRELIISDIFDYLQHRPYAGLKLPSQHPEQLSQYSDLDLLMSIKVTKDMERYLKAHPLIKKIQVLSGTALTRMMIVGNNHEIISLDGIHQLKRKHLEYMSVQEMIDQCTVNRDGIKHVNETDTKRFIGFFYGLNGACLPEKFSPQKDAIMAELPVLNRQFSPTDREEVSQQQELTTYVKGLKANRGLSLLFNHLTYWYDLLKQSVSNKGIIITFSGVDGAGKSTIIEKVKLEVEKKLRKRVVVIRHRPSLLPILSAWTMGKEAAEKTAAEGLPRQGTNKHFLNSLLRFTYYYSDYLIGQFYIYLRYVCRGYVVLYDRYYFDFINDSLRSNITLPKWFLKSGYNFLYAPHLNFFLYADAEVILSRKRELDKTTIQLLTRDYLDLFQQLGKSHPSRYHAIENVTMDNTLIYVSNQIQKQLL